MYTSFDIVYIILSAQKRHKIVNFYPFFEKKAFLMKKPQNKQTSALFVTLVCCFLLSEMQSCFRFLSPCILLHILAAK